ncbi:MAG: hypothetical protein WB697_21495 [Stellaceae bacterium]
MTRTKWMRLAVKDPADILRWAGAQNTRQLDEFRHRMIHGREFVSFRMVPRYRVEIGTSDIVVVAHVAATARHRMIAAIGGLAWRTARLITGAIAALRPQVTPPRSAELYAFAPARLPTRSVR